jgi:hypothetical protein
MKKLFAFFLINCCFFGYSQEKTPEPNNRIGVAFSPGVIIQRNAFIEANLFVGKIIIEDQPKVPVIGVSGFRIGIELDCSKTFAPKIGYEIAIVGLAIRLSAANYFQEGNSEFRLLPEIGLSMGGWASLTYGYGISFNDRTITDIGHHRVCLSFNLNKRLNKAVLKGIM